MSKYLSRKFLLAVAVIALIIADQKLNLGLGIDSEQAMKVLMAVALGYIGIEGAIDIVKTVKKDKKDDKRISNKNSK